MTDEAPVPNDSLGSLFVAASWVYPRVWAGSAQLWAVIILPGDLFLVALSRALGSPEQAVILAAVKMAVTLPLVIVHFWASAVMCDAILRGGVCLPKDALRLMLSRLPGQAWTCAHVVVRVIPLGILAGAAAVCVIEAKIAAAVALAAIAGTWLAYLIVRWALSPLVTLLEDLSGGAALRRSGELSGARFWLFGFHYGVYYVGMIAISLLAPWLAVKLAPAWSVDLICGVVNVGMIRPFFTGMITALYRREFARAAAKAEAPV